MPSLPDELFSLLENKTLKARESAEKAARNITAYLKVESSAWWGEKDDPQRSLWLGLRARARQLGYAVEDDTERDPVRRGLPQLAEEIAYEQWHRMLFARFLAENHLLMHPSGVAVSLAECEELAPEEGEDDAWRLAARYASAMLPGIFKQEDPCTQVHLTPSDHHTLEAILLEIPALVFTCDDALGWMYQFWQSKKKDEVNASERKIGGADLSPVTQLFTEDYMVRFLLENSLGAWWAARHPGSPLVKEWEYLRFKDDGSPAAGSFPGWPQRAAEVTVMDPCCGSGHFLVAAFDMLRRMRMEEERLETAEAARRTLQDNIFGLEIDQRCTQIAWFALSLVGWKSGGYQSLPELNIACTGIPVKGQLNDWLALAGDDSRVKAGLERLYNLFKDAPDLGSLINPADVPLVDRMFVADYEQVAPVFEAAIKVEQLKQERQDSLLGFVANSILKATKYLSGKYTVVVTNVPYLAIGRENSTISQFCKNNYPKSKNDLAFVFIERLKYFIEENSTFCFVATSGWTFQNRERHFRKEMLNTAKWRILCRLGAGAFRTISGEVVQAMLAIMDNTIPDGTFFTLDAGNISSCLAKSQVLRTQELLSADQSHLRKSTNTVINFSNSKENKPLGLYASALRGLSTGDINWFFRYFWEITLPSEKWDYIQSETNGTEFYGGRSQVILWENGKGTIAKIAEELKHLNHAIQSWRRGKPNWGKWGVAINVMGGLNVTLYSGDKYTANIGVLIPKNKSDLIPLWKYCSSDEFKKSVRSFNKKISVEPRYFEKVLVNFEDWKERYKSENELPEPYSDNPSQWLFKGHPLGSSAPLQVAIARLLGYRWPEQVNDLLNTFSDADSIVCPPAVNGEAPAAERLRTLLAMAYSSDWSGAKQEELLAAVGYSGKDLADWLRDSFFEQHCKLFHNRPFIWHIWDGRKDGFSALVNYHKLDRANLEKLTYTYLGTWITDRKKELEQGAAGAEGRLLAAQALQDKLKLILAGEPPYDIYVRWKPLHEQPMGWEPDLNDGVRLNIRPFVTAGVLRSKFTINWNKDRGKNPDGSERLNDLHFTIAEKRAAREKQRK